MITQKLYLEKDVSNKIYESKAMFKKVLLATFCFTKHGSECFSPS